MVDLNNTNQVSHMTESCQILSDTLDMIEGYVKPGQSVMELDRLAEEYILSRDAKPAFKGYNNFPSTLTVSIDDEVVHGIPKDVVLEEGQIVGIDCGVLKNDYYSDSARTLAVGKISEEKQSLLDITKEALEIGISKAVVGNRVFDISDAIQKHVESKGYSIVRELVGHGIGTQLHLEPQVPNFSTPRSAGHDIELKEG
ncbi:MAG: type I methionyl aminopeptidase, partial [Candidatus Marinimicrobia bacterium]|nr:type I methionyl aminopeptidase [Candidatus Neomarinimicrobiota bacterium]